MAHAHHNGESVSNYFTEQLLTILVCGLFGFVAVQLYRNGMLDKLLAPQFHLWVLIGGSTILALVVLRAIAIWKEAGEFQAAAAGGYACGVNHTHGPDCDHDPGIGGTADHDHSHDMSWTFARMLILIFPVALFFLGLPNAGFSQARQLELAGGGTAIGAAELKDLAKDATVYEEKDQGNGVTVRVLKTKTGLKIRQTVTASGGEPKLELIAAEGTQMRFNELNEMAYSEEKRNSYAGETAILEGRFKRIADKEFTLFRLKMTCCVADTVALKVRIVVPQAPNGLNEADWVQVKGQIQFFQIPGGRPGAEMYIPVIMVADITDVRKVEAKNEYEQ